MRELEVSYRDARDLALGKLVEASQQQCLDNVS